MTEETKADAVCRLFALHPPLLTLILKFVGLDDCFSLARTGRYAQTVTAALRKKAEGKLVLFLTETERYNKMADVLPPGDGVLVKAQKTIARARAFVSSTGYATATKLNLRDMEQSAVRAMVNAFPELRETVRYLVTGRWLHENFCPFPAVTHLTLHESAELARLFPQLRSLRQIGDYSSWHLNLPHCTYLEIERPPWNAEGVSAPSLQTLVLTGDQPDLKPFRACPSLASVTLARAHRLEGLSLVALTAAEQLRELHLFGAKWPVEAEAPADEDLQAVLEGTDGPDGKDGGEDDDDDDDEEEHVPLPLRKGGEDGKEASVKAQLAAASARSGSGAGGFYYALRRRMATA